MKVTVRKFGEGGVEQVFQLEDPFDVIIEVGIQAFTRRFWISQPPSTSLLQVRVDGRLIIEPETANAICLAEVR